MTTMNDWNDTPLSCACSRGGVLVTTHPFDNLIRTGCRPWPPPEIVQKLYQSRQIRAFDPDQAALCTAGLGYYCDLQSLHSEDAITWSVFGTLRYAAAESKERWLKDFFGMLQIPAIDTADADLFLWRRIPHPDTLVPGGPEIDFGIITGNEFVLGEAKWRSTTGSSQGKAKDKDQIQLREEFLSTYGRTMFPEHEQFIVVGVGLTDLSFQGVQTGKQSFRTITWEKLCSLPSHPHAAELRRYYLWKCEHSQPSGTVRKARRLVQ